MEIQHVQTPQLLQDFQIDLTKFDVHNHYKEYKQEMVQGFTGMQGQHRMLLLSVFFNQVYYFSQLLTQWLRIKYKPFDQLRTDPYSSCRKIFLNSVIDILLTLWPPIILQMHLSNIEVYMVSFAAGIMALHSQLPGNDNASNLVSMEDVNGKQSVRINFWTQVKATTMLGTTIAILAIDFPSIFERAHSKSEEFGISVMDSGVALITLNAGLSSRKARPWFQATNRQSLLSELVQTVIQSIIPIVLGFIRIAMVSQFDYQEHASEYGIHWNFYTTIALVSIMMVFLRNPDYALPVAFLLMIGYEFVLQEFNLATYIFYAPRTEFISANREGIATLVGYLSLQLIGVGFGNIMYKSLLTPDQIKQLRASKNIEIKPQNECRFIGKVILLALVFYVAYFLSCEAFMPASRRLCNLSFVLYHAACVLAGCAMGAVMDSMNPQRQVNFVEQAISYNQLQFFITCNLLTGLVNVTMQTYFQGVLVAHLVMFTYFFTEVFFISFCRKHRCCKRLVP